MSLIIALMIFSQQVPLEQNREESAAVGGNHLRARRTILQVEPESCPLSQMVIKHEYGTAIINK